MNNEPSPASHLPETPPPFRPTPPPAHSNKTRNIVIGCLVAFLICLGLGALILTMICSQLGNMH